MEGEVLGDGFLITRSPLGINAIAFAVAVPCILRVPTSKGVAGAGEHVLGNGVGSACIGILRKLLCQFSDRLAVLGCRRPAVAIIGHGVDDVGPHSGKGIFLVKGPTHERLRVGCGVVQVVTIRACKVHRNGSFSTIRSSPTVRINLEFRVIGEHNGSLLPVLILVNNRPVLDLPDGVQGQVFLCHRRGSHSAADAGIENPIRLCRIRVRGPAKEGVAVLLRLIRNGVKGCSVIDIVPHMGGGQIRKRAAVGVEGHRAADGLPLGGKGEVALDFPSGIVEHPRVSLRVIGPTLEGVPFLRRIHRFLNLCIFLHLLRFCSVPLAAVEIEGDGVVDRRIDSIEGDDAVLIPISFSGHGIVKVPHFLFRGGVLIQGPAKELAAIFGVGAASRLGNLLPGGHFLVPCHSLITVLRIDHNGELLRRDCHRAGGDHFRVVLRRDGGGDGSRASAHAGDGAILGHSDDGIVVAGVGHGCVGGQVIQLCFLALPHCYGVPAVFGERGRSCGWRYRHADLVGRDKAVVVLLGEVNGLGVSFPCGQITLGRNGKVAAVFAHSKVGVRFTDGRVAPAGVLGIQLRTLSRQRIVRHLTQVHVLGPAGGESMALVVARVNRMHPTQEGISISSRILQSEVLLDIDVPIGTMGFFHHNLRAIHDSNRLLCSCHGIQVSYRAVAVAPLGNKRFWAIHCC